MGQEKKTVVSTLKNENYFIIFFLFSFLLFSCNNESQKADIMINAIDLSNDFYIKNTESLKMYFDLKIKEEPEKYDEIAKTIEFIDKKKDNYLKLTTLEERKSFLTELENLFNSISENKDIAFLSISVNNSDIELFEIIVKNDFNRNFYKLYTELYNYQHVSYVNGLK